MNEILQSAKLCHNKRKAGSLHQGAFYRITYDVTDPSLTNAGFTLILPSQKAVKKESGYVLLHIRFLLFRFYFFLHIYEMLLAVIKFILQECHFL